MQAPIVSSPDSDIDTASLQDRGRSAWAVATRYGRPAPQSWPTRSTGSSNWFNSPTSQSTYSSFVAPKPGGRGQPKPGIDSATDSPSRFARNLSQILLVSGTPCTNTIITQPYRRQCSVALRTNGVSMSKVIVVGGGPTGLATAMLLAKRGVEVVVLDREAPAPMEVDDLWENWERRSVAQFHQVHYLQPAAHAQLAAHLPEVLEHMATAGVEEFNVPELQARHMPAGDKD